MPVPDKRTVLVAIDGSEYSEKAFDWYAGKFRQANDQVVFLHVYEAPITPPPTFAHCTSLPSKEEWELMLQKAETKAKKMLAKFEKKCKDYKLPFKSIFAHGAIGHMICTTAKEENVEVIVLGNRGLGTIRRTIFGSVCDYVTQRMPVPVLMQSRSQSLRSP